MLRLPIDEALEEHGVEPGDHVDAGHDHGGGVDERGHRGRAGHGVGQPGVQEELARLRHHRGEQAAATPTSSSRWSMPPLVASSLIVEDVEAVWPAPKNSDDHADEQADVADAVGDERLERGVGVRLLLPPVADEHERADADELPAGEELQRVARSSRA